MFLSGVKIIFALQDFSPYSRKPEVAAESKFIFPRNSLTTWLAAEFPTWDCPCPCFISSHPSTCKTPTPHLWTSLQCWYLIRHILCQQRKQYIFPSQWLILFLANFHFHANQVPIRLSVHSLPDSTSAIYKNSAVYSTTWHFSSGASALYITSTVCQAMLQTPSSVLGKPAVPKLDEFRRFSDTTKFIVDFLTHWGFFFDQNQIHKN